VLVTCSRVRVSGIVPARALFPVDVSDIGRRHGPHADDEDEREHLTGT